MDSYDAARLRAEEMMWEAWECQDQRLRFDLARRAIEIFPDCADALMLLADELAHTPEEKLAMYRRAAEAADRLAASLAASVACPGGESGGPLPGEQPHAGVVARAHIGLAWSLAGAGMTDEAVTECERLLADDQEDELGVRYVLAQVLLGAGRAADLEGLFGRYTGDESAAWLYTRALMVFSTTGATAEAVAALDQARNANPHVPAFLLGERELPPRFPEFTSSGDLYEGAAYALEFKSHWESVPGALAFLRRYVAGSGGRVEI